MNPLQPEIHPLAPFLPPNARLLLLGSFPPPRKRWSMDFFYPNYTNDMWRIFGLIFFDDKQHRTISTGKSHCCKRYSSRCQSPKRKCLRLNPRSRRAIKSGRNTRSNSSLSYSGDHRTKGNRHITFYHRFTSSCDRRVRRFSLP